MMASGEHHTGIDIFALKRTPLVAVQDGTIEELRWRSLGGNSLHLVNDQRRLLLLRAPGSLRPRDQQRRARHRRRGDRLRGQHRQRALHGTALPLRGPSGRRRPGEPVPVPRGVARRESRQARAACNGDCAGGPRVADTPSQLSRAIASDDYDDVLRAEGTPLGQEPAGWHPSPGRRRRWRPPRGAPPPPTRTPGRRPPAGAAPNLDHPRADGGRRRCIPAARCFACHQ